MAADFRHCGETVWYLGSNRQAPPAGTIPFATLQGESITGLKYQSQYESSPFRWLDRAQKIRTPLGRQRVGRGVSVFVPVSMALFAPAEQP